MANALDIQVCTNLDVVRSQCIGHVGGMRRCIEYVCGSKETQVCTNLDVAPWQMHWIYIQVCTDVDVVRGKCIGHLGEDALNSWAALTANQGNLCGS